MLISSFTPYGRGLRGISYLFWWLEKNVVYCNINSDNYGIK